MNLLQMSFSGGVLILAVIVLRALTLNRLPKGTFLALWAVAVLRLLVPFSIPSPASVYTLAEHVQVQMEVTEPTAPADVQPMPAVPSVPGPAPAGNAAPAAAAVPSESGPAVVVDVWHWVWLAGAAVCGAFFLLSYFRCRREFQTALPVEDTELRAWLAVQCLRRTVSLRQSDRIHAPLTYGLLRPVILLPENWKDEAQLDYVLEHELAHVRSLDALWKLLFVLVACVHWFNPLVWCMFILANRDMELRCDEAVVRQRGLDSRSGYALTLISLEEKKSGLGPFASAFSKNAIEERIRAIMKIKKRSAVAIAAAALLVCCVTACFATSAAAENSETKMPVWSEIEEEMLEAAWRQSQAVLRIKDAMDELLPELEKDEKLWIANQYILGYSDLTVTEYRQKVQMKWDHTGTETWDALDHYVELRDTYHPADALSDFDEYFFNICLPLIKDGWEDGHEFSGEVQSGRERLEYTCTLRVLNADTLTVGKYQQAIAAVKSGLQSLLKSGDLLPEDVDGLSRRLSTDELSVSIEAGLPVRAYDPAATDAELHAQSSRETAAEWDRLLTPYAPLGLTWAFDDPDLDGNGLTMWWGGKEVSGISDEQEHIWITEHTGTGFSEGAIELYAVYTNGVLSGLREAGPDEQGGFDKIREENRIRAESFQGSAETREFPPATREDYDALLTLRTEGYDDLTLEDFNQCLLDWTNENPDAWDRINCDVIWNEYGVELSGDEWLFATFTCRFSGTENGQMIRALHTGGPEQDPHFSASLPGRTAEKNGIVTAWCDLYYDISYHIADKSAVTVRERDALVGGMINAINTFWRDTDLDALLTMTEDDVVSWLNAWADAASTENIKFNPITENNIHFETYDERGID